MKQRHIPHRPNLAPLSLVPPTANRHPGGGGWEISPQPFGVKGMSCVQSQPLNTQPHPVSRRQMAEPFNTKIMRKHSRTWHVRREGIGTHHGVQAVMPRCGRRPKGPTTQSWAGGVEGRVPGRCDSSVAASHHTLSKRFLDQSRDCYARCRTTQLRAASQ
jgi:hypothetical protein